MERDGKQDGVVVFAAALKSEDPKVRAEIVRSAKKIGGDDVRLIIEHAKKDQNAELRNAAEEALKD